MKKTIKLKESDITRMVMETVNRLHKINEDDKARYIGDYNEFDQDGFDSTGDEKKNQEDAAWDLYNSSKLPYHSYDDSESYRNDNVEDNFLRGYYSLLSQGYDNVYHREASPSDIAFGREHRGNSDASVEAGYHNWLGGGLPNEEEFNDDGPLPIIGANGCGNGKIANRNHYSGNYAYDIDALEESIRRATRKVIKRRLR